MTTDLELDTRITDALNRAAGTAEINHASSRSKIASAAADTRRSRRDPRHVARGWIATVRPVTIMTASLIGVAVIGGVMIMNSRNNSNEHPASSEQPSTFQPSGTEFPISPTATALGRMFVVKPGTASTVSIPGHPDITSYISVVEDGGHVREFHCFQSGGGGSCNSAWWSASTTTTSTVNNGLGDFDVWAWGDVPPNAAFVTWTAGSTTLWQRPVAGIAAFPFQRGDGDIVRLAVALDANGNEIARTDGTFSGFGDNPNPDAGLVSNLDRSGANELGNLAQTSMTSCLLANGDSSWDLCLTEADQAVQSRFVELGGKLVAPPAADPTQPADTTSESPTTPTTVVVGGTDLVAVGTVVCLDAGASDRAVVLCEEEFGGVSLQAATISADSFVMPVDPLNASHLADSERIGQAFNLPVRPLDTSILPSESSPGSNATIYLVLGTSDIPYAP